MPSNQKLAVPEPYSGQALIFKYLLQVKSPVRVPPVKARAPTSAAVGFSFSVYTFFPAIVRVPSGLILNQLLL